MSLHYKIFLSFPLLLVLSQWVLLTRPRPCFELEKILYHCSNRRLSTQPSAAVWYWRVPFFPNHTFSNAIMIYDMLHCVESNKSICMRFWMLSGSFFIIHHFQSITSLNVITCPFKVGQYNDPHKLFVTTKVQTDAICSVK